MIWYDVATGEPVAPGSCEDAGLPSLNLYKCHVCNLKRELRFDTYCGAYETKIGRCKTCWTLLLTTG